MIYSLLSLRTGLLALLVACLSFSSAAHAQIILNEEFDGSLDGWAITAGRGTAQVTSYAGNSSLRLTRNAAAVRAVTLPQADQFDISASFAASGLEGDDACLIEFSPDGQSWYQIGQIGDGQDDGLTLHVIEGSIVFQSEDNQSAYIGLRVAGNADNDMCWADKIRLISRFSEKKLPATVAPAGFETGQVPDRPFSTAAFMRPENAQAPAHLFSGTLSLQGGKMANFILLKDSFSYAATSETVSVLPPVSVAVLQIGDELVPAEREPIPGTHPDWEWMFSPGKVWTDPSDEAMSRAVLPFALVERNANCVHNGLATFRFNDAGDISHFVYQIGSETCAYIQFDAWGAVPASYQSHEIAARDEIAAAYAAEKAARLDIRPMSSLPAGIAKGFGAPEEVAPSAMTLFGYVADGVHYTGGCDTRYGPYPYCNALILPSYSWAKSLAAGIAAMRLEKLYPGAMQSLVSGYIPACSAPRWRGVTFANALDMASGIFDSEAHEVDEGSGKMRRFFLAESHEEKIRLACTAFDRKAQPGTKFIYRTGDTYIFGAAINAFLQSKTGKADADYYDDLLKPIWTRLGMSPISKVTRRTYDEVQQPFSGWGLFLYRNDIALVTGFLQNGGNIAGEDLLDSAMISAAMQRDPANRGLRAVIDAQRYQHGFWAWNAGPVIGCQEDVWIPAMSGFGGLSAALMPNGPVYYYVSDGGAFTWRRGAQASNQFRPFCEVAK